MKSAFPLAIASLLFVLPAVHAQSHASHASHAGHDHKPAAASSAPDASTKLTEAHFDALDADKDGFIVKAELPAKHPLADHFSMADRSRDGKLDKREFKLLVGMQ